METVFIREFKSSNLSQIAKSIFDMISSSLDGAKTSSNLHGVVVEECLRDEKLLDILEKKLKPHLEVHIDDYFSFTPLLHKENFKFSHYSLMHHKEGYNIPFHYDSEYVYEKEGVEEVRNFAILLYLNDLEEWGALVFPLQKKTIKPEQGKLLIFPTSFMYPHTTIPTMSSDRFVLRVSYYFEKDQIKKSVEESRDY